MKKKMINGEQTLIRLLPVLVFAFCVLQPILDVLSYWQDQLGIGNSLTVLLRLALLGGSVLLGFCLSQRKGYYVAAAGLMGGYLIARTVSFILAGDSDPLGDLSNMVRICYLPLTTLCMTTFLRRNARVIRGIRDGMAVDLLLIGAVMVMSYLTGTDPYTYVNKALGVRGWFLITSTQSAILSMVVPVAIGWALTRWDRKVLPVAVVTALGLGALYAYATRLAVASMLAAGFGMGICLLLIDLRRWRQSVAILAVTVLAVVLLPLSPMAENQTLVGQNMEKKQAYVDACLENADPEEPEEWDEALLRAYERYIPGVISRFGGEAALEAYGRTTDAEEIANVRKMKLIFCELMMEESPASARFLGMNRTGMYETALVENAETGVMEQTQLCFDPENDFHGIYYLCGGIGLVLTVLMIAFYALRALLAMGRDFRRYFTVDFAAFGICCCIAVAYCWFTASILRHNSGSVYFAMALAALGHLSRRELCAQGRGFFRNKEK